VSLNPSHNRPVIAATRENQIRLPTDRVDAFMQAMERHLADGQPLVSWQPYEMKQGETVALLAARAGITASRLLEANGLSVNAEVLPGSVMLVPSAGASDDALLRSFDGPRIRERVLTPARYHLVRQGETLAAIARRHGVTVANLSRLNGNRNAVQPGQRLLVRPASARTVVRSLGVGTSPANRDRAMR
jgi:membrane-bound lytic murein transglycosylase D